MSSNNHPEIVYIAFGSSVTANDPKHGVPEDLTYFMVAARKLEEALGRPVDAIKAGIGGHTTRNALERLQSEVLDRRPDLVSVQFGVNDGSHPAPAELDSPPQVPPEEFRANLIEIARRIRSVGASPIFTTLQPLGPDFGRSETPFYAKYGRNYEPDRYSEIIREVAREIGVPCAEFRQGLLDRPDWESLIPDGAHPNTEGHRIMAEALLPALMKAMEERDCN